MNLRRNIIPFLVSVVVLFAVCVPVLRANVPQDRKTFRYAVSLFDGGMYERAAELFASLAGVGTVAWDNGAVGAGDAFDASTNGLSALEIDFNGALDIEALGYYVLCAVKMQTRGYTVLANSYILKYPYGSLVPQIRFAHATICFDMGDYKGADSQLQPLSRRKLYHRQVPAYLFMRALSTLELGEEDAKSQFEDVINYKKSNNYVLPAHYFLGYIYYGEGNLSEAREHFALAVDDPQFKTLAERYLVECGGSVSQGTAAGGSTATATGSAGTVASSANATANATANASTTVATTAETASANASEVTSANASVTSSATTSEAASANAAATSSATTASATTASVISANAAEGETAYLLILNSYNKSDFENVEERVLDFAESDSPNQYWLAKAFIILGDSYAEQGEFDKALATFESVRDGYNPDEPDDVKDELDVRIRRAQEMLNKKK